MDALKESLPFKPTVIGAVVFIVAVAGAIYIARKVPVLNKIA